MTTYDLTYENGYLLIALCDGLYVLDTGAPRTFGNADTLAIGGETLPQVQEFAGLTAGKVSATAGQPVQGLLGTDILNQFDILVDIPRETVTFSTNALTLQGEAIPLEFLVRSAQTEGSDWRPIAHVPVRYWRPDQLLARRGHRPVSGSGHVRRPPSRLWPVRDSDLARADELRGAGLRCPVRATAWADRRDGQNDRRIGDSRKRDHVAITRRLPAATVAIVGLVRCPTGLDGPLL